MDQNNSNNWIVSYVDFMTVIMAFFISFTLIATKVAAASELFIVRTMSKIEKKLNKELSSEYTVQNMGYSGIRIIFPAEINGIPMFNVNQSFINKSFKPYIDTLAQIIVDSTIFYDSYREYEPFYRSKGRSLNMNFRVEGHTDASGDNIKNMNLSLKRAEQTKNYLVNNSKFNEDNFSICGYGESRPVNDILLYDENRRVELILNYTLNNKLNYLKNDSLNLKIKKPGERI
ncbi:MAG: hypothetical protein CMF96_12940 [Candidatus Marinimicrobia bacterium]|nr:hypothetical protein [Candidatus Neomarinimicrobiota bacterium]|tara:strand:- start:1106 stop:1798 length:693 start_codon:yes stop_codon:yes gene_type:complete